MSGCPHAVRGARYAVGLTRRGRRRALAGHLRDQRDDGNNGERHVHPSSSHTCLHVGPFHASRAIIRQYYEQRCCRPNLPSCPIRKRRSRRSTTTTTGRNITSSASPDRWAISTGRRSRDPFAASRMHRSSRCTRHPARRPMGMRRGARRLIRRVSSRYRQNRSARPPSETCSGTRWGCRRGKYSRRRGGRCA